ncbi:ATPase inhibitor, mitochondrial-like [Heterocephalus glaber]|uniref:ATPase inhibitor, mitochondrial n=1 Tax=Heterocephalus glaber TaxID=10181 RepID=A0AAX6T9J4_HETGA|nr:ATPase inhibitor, mitochondrial-like [Heterocephalus glaber]
MVHCSVSVVDLQDHRADWELQLCPASKESMEQWQDHESSSGSIRDAGGAFGKREQAEEEPFFQQKTKEQLEALKKHHEDEIYHHKKAIECMEKEIERHKQKIKQLKHDD